RECADNSSVFHVFVSDYSAGIYSLLTFLFPIADSAKADGWVVQYAQLGQVRFLPQVSRSLCHAVVNLDPASSLYFRVFPAALKNFCRVVWSKEILRPG
ncbi:hypothetical protein M9458_057844, partial [Cirrhinus mrigala]